MADLTSGAVTPLQIAFEGSTWGTLPGTPLWYTFATLPGRKGTGKRAFVENPLMAADPNPRDARLGKKDVTADFTTVFGVKTAPYLAKLALGSLATVGAADPYAHTAKLVGTPRNLPSIQMEDEIGLSPAAYKLVKGLRCSSFNLKGTHEGFVQAALQFKGRDAGMSATKTNATPTDWQDDTWYDWTQLTGVTVNSVTAGNVAEFDLTVAHELAANYFPMGSGNLLGAMARGMSSVTGSLKFGLDTTAATTIYGYATAETYVPVSFTLTSAVNRTCVITLPRVLFEVGEPDIDKDEIYLTLPFRASKDATAGTSVQIVCNNDQAGTVYA